MQQKLQQATCNQQKLLHEVDIKTKLQVTIFFDNELGVIAKSKVTVTLNKPVYLGMCTL